MANWYGQTRTNYFKVKDEERYQELYGRLMGEEAVEDFTVKKSDGEHWHAFGSYSDICFYERGEDGTIDYDNDQVDMYTFYKEIAKILQDDSVFVITCTGAEKLRYLTGYCAVVFPDGTIVEETLDGFAIKTVKEKYGDNYALYLDY